jgi:hypothetical protein
MDVVCSSETSVDLYQSTISCIAENNTLHSYCCVNLKSNTRIHLRTIEGLLAFIRQIKSLDLHLIRIYRGECRRVPRRTSRNQGSGDTFGCRMATCGGPSHRTLGTEMAAPTAPLR